jgi:hypothetical protein
LVSRTGAAVRLQRPELENSPHLDLIKKQAKVEVDVRYIGRLEKRAKASRAPKQPKMPKELKTSAAEVPWYQKRNRPLRIGSSIGHFVITAGAGQA